MMRNVDDENVHRSRLPGNVKYKHLSGHQAGSSAPQKYTAMTKLWAQAVILSWLSVAGDWEEWHTRSGDTLTDNSGHCVYWPGSTHHYCVHCDHCDHWGGKLGMRTGYNRLLLTSDTSQAPHSPHIAISHQSATLLSFSLVQLYLSWLLSHLIPCNPGAALSSLASAAW